MPKFDILYIFAGNKQEAVDWAWQYNIHPDDYIYVYNLNQLKIVRNRTASFVRVGTWVNHRNAAAIHRKLYLGHFTEIFWDKNSPINTERKSFDPKNLANGKPTRRIWATRK